MAMSKGGPRSAGTAVTCSVLLLKIVTWLEAVFVRTVVPLAVSIFPSAAPLSAFANRSFCASTRMRPGLLFEARAGSELESRTLFFKPETGGLLELELLEELPQPASSMAVTAAQTIKTQFLRNIIELNLPCFETNRDYNRATYSLDLARAAALRVPAARGVRAMG